MTAVLFTSYEFVIFAAITAMLYFAVPGRVQWCVLLIASYLFYLSAGPEYLIFLLYTTLVSYGTALLMQRNADAEDAFVEVGFTPEQYRIITETDQVTYRIKFKFLEFFESLFSKK